MSSWSRSPSDNLPCRRSRDTCVLRSSRDPWPSLSSAMAPQEIETIAENEHGSAFEVRDGDEHPAVDKLVENNTHIQTICNIYII